MTGFNGLSVSSRVFGTLALLAGLVVSPLSASADTFRIEIDYMVDTDHSHMPQPDEIAACEPFLKRQLEIIAPKVIVGLGRHAVQTLLQTKTPISRLRGQWHQYHHIAFMPTFHPAYLLRRYNVDTRGKVWSDLQEVMQFLGLPPPKGK